MSTTLDYKNLGIRKSELLQRFNEFKPRLKSCKNRFQLSARLKSWKIEYNFKWNQPYLSRARGLNSLNTASVPLK